MTVSLPSKLEQSYLKAKFALFKADSKVYNGLPQFFLRVCPSVIYFSNHSSLWILNYTLYRLSHSKSTCMLLTLLL